MTTNTPILPHTSVAFSTTESVLTVSSVQEAYYDEARGIWLYTVVGQEYKFVERELTVIRGQGKIMFEKDEFNYSIKFVRSQGELL